MVSVNTDRTNYLSLALDARKTIKALRQASETGNESEELKGAIDDTVNLQTLQFQVSCTPTAAPQYTHQVWVGHGFSHAETRTRL